MPDRRLSVRDRVQILRQLEQGARWLNLVAVWLGEQGCESEGDMIEGIARDMLAAAFLLERPLSPRLPPQPWPQPAQADGQQQAG